LLAAKASFIAGAGAWLLWTVFVHAAEAVPIGISQALLGVPTLLGAPWNVVDPLVVSLPLSTFVIVAVQALCQPLGTPVSGSEPES